MPSLYLAWSLGETSGSRSRSGCSLRSGASAQTAQNPGSVQRGDQKCEKVGRLWVMNGFIGTRLLQYMWRLHWCCFTWIRERMLAKWVSIAPPCGKFWFILFMSSVKQLKAMASERRKQGGEEAGVRKRVGNSVVPSITVKIHQMSEEREDKSVDSPSSRMTRSGASRSHMPCT